MVLTYAVLFLLLGSAIGYLLGSSNKNHDDISIKNKIVYSVKTVWIILSFIVFAIIIYALIIAGIGA